MLFLLPFWYDLNSIPCFVYTVAHIGIPSISPPRLVFMPSTLLPPDSEGDNEYSQQYRERYEEHPRLAD